MPKLLTGAKLSEREQELRRLHKLAGSDRARLRALLESHRGRWPRTEGRRDMGMYFHLKRANAA